jgi:peptide/nickel transport system ATP-binding protein/oligopeptide transport system ATP-binding protein
MNQRDIILKVENLKTYYPLKGMFGKVHSYVKAVNDVSFSVYKGETYGLVGETGCGKSTLGRTIIRLTDPVCGSVVFDGHDLSHLSEKEMMPIRPKIQMVFQDPYSSLNPRKTIGDTLTEVFDIHKIGTKAERVDRVLDALSRVGLRHEYFYRYPHELSGGQRQRVGLARAILLKPQLVICDEPVSALDVSIRSQIINLFNDFQEEYNLTYIFIAHDLSVVHYVSKRIGVMYLGHIVEEGPSAELFENPLHPYTRALLSALPSMNPNSPRDRVRLKGELPSPINPPPGCPFHTRCPDATPACAKNEPHLHDIGGGHRVSCSLVKPQKYTKTIPAIEGRQKDKGGVRVMYDLVLRNAFLIDGTGGPGYKGDLAVKDGKIAALGCVEITGESEIDVAGFALAPGFIDSHGHSDLIALEYPQLANKLEQGITTELAGQCGQGPAPSLSDASVKNYPDFGSFARKLAETPIGINLALFVPHGSVRAAVMGYERREPTVAEFAKISAFVREGMESGAIGMSTGLAYIPGLFSNQTEVIGLARVVAEYDGAYASHMRNQADRVVESVTETIAVGRDAGCTVAISHHKAMGPTNWGKLKITTELINKAVQAGQKVIHDVYPYLANSTTLINALPPAELGGGPSSVTSRLKDKEYQKYLEDQIFNPTQQWENNIKNVGYSKHLVTKAPKTPEAVGKFISEYADKLGIASFDALMRLLIENETRVNVSIYNMAEEDVLTIIKNPYASICTDGHYAPSEKGTIIHPRNFGTFPRFLGRYIREQKLLSLEEGIRRITSLPANIYSLKRKGRLLPGYDADLTVFNPDTIMDRADFKSHDSSNVGIEYVFVAGKLVLSRGKANGILAGTFLSRKR